MKVVEKSATSTPCLIIGSGHNGLSVAGALRRRGVDPILLEQHAAVGDQWRQRYERLHLHHITDAMHLYGVPYPEPVPRYLSRLDLADYLEAYATLYDLDVRLEHRVTHLSRNQAGRWEAEVERKGELTNLLFTADEVVLAAGVTGVTPNVPDLQGREEWEGEVLHSQQYHNTEGFEGKRVLIVGSGNSAVEICCDLYDHGAVPSMLIRGPNSWVTREAYAIYHRAIQFGIPILKTVPLSWILAPLVIFGLDRFFQFDIRRRYGDLSSKGIFAISRPPLLNLAATRGEGAPTYVDGTWGDVGASIFELIRDDEIPVLRAEISHFEQGSKTVVFQDGTSAEFDVVILCTGFQSILAHYASFLDESVMETLTQKDVLRPLEPMNQLPGLWLSLGGLVSARFGQVVLGERIAAKIQNQRPPTRIFNAALTFIFAGPDPFQLQIPRLTILINLLAVLALLALLI